MGNGCRESGFPTTRRELASTVALSVRRRGTPFSAIRKPLRQLPFGTLRQSAENRPFQRQKTTISSPFTIPLSTLFGHPLPYPVFPMKRGKIGDGERRNHLHHRRERRGEGRAGSPIEKKPSEWGQKWAMKPTISASIKPHRQERATTGRIPLAQYKKKS